MKKIPCIMLALLMAFLASSLYAQASNPLDDMFLNGKQQPESDKKKADQEDLSNDIIIMKYEKKNAQLAMLMSAIVPGAGQFYADKSSFTTYLFPIIEAAVIGGIIYYDNKGDKKTKEYKKYVTEETTLEFGDYTYTGPRYRRDFQAAVQDTLIRIHSNDIYDGLFFSLDPTDTQHFFEDIGKYDKYIFGWVDWYFKYAELPPVGDFLNPQPIFIFDISNPANQLFNSPENKWRYNIPLTGDATQDVPYSDLRKEYIKMRRDAEDEYSVARNLYFGIAFNHIISAIDAVRLTRKVNRLYLSDNNVKFNYYAAVHNGRMTPMLNLNFSF